MTDQQKDYEAIDEIRFKEYRKDCPGMAKVMGGEYCSLTTDICYEKKNCTLWYWFTKTRGF